MRKHITRLTALSVLASGLLALPGVAAGVTADEKRAEARRLQEQIDANGEKATALAEAFNAAVIKHERSSSAIEQAKQRVAENQARVNTLRGIVTRRAAEAYKRAGMGISVSEDIDSITETTRRNKYASAATGADKNVMGELAKANEKLEAQKQDLQRQKDEAATEKDALADKRAELDGLQEKQEQLLAQVKGDLAQLVEAERDRRAREAASRQQAQPAAPGPGRKATPAELPNVPAPSPGAAAAIAFARAQLGKPYRYAAVGPDAFDCSGLTMMAWRAGGVSLPHYSGAQYAMLPKVGVSQLQPGDLVFRGPGGSAHVGLYIGGGLMITAPQTGDVVKIASIGRVDGAARPG